MPCGPCGMAGKIPVSVLIVTRNEERNLARCLAALEAFDEIIVVDSASSDATADIARSYGVQVVPFAWNGRYPKKRQWCLDTLTLKHERVFFVDADEEVTPALCAEIENLDWSRGGYFVCGVYVMKGRPLYHGLKNSKLCLFDRRVMEFPVVDDLSIAGMGEMEGHYQPVFKKGLKGRTGKLKNPLLHHAMEDSGRYRERHESYALWERQMRSANAYPADPSFCRRVVKSIFARIPMRPAAAFIHSYVLCKGFMMGRDGFDFAKSRFDYYRLIER